MSHQISGIYEFYSESEVHYFSFLRVDNDTISLPSEPTFDVQKSFLNCKMSLVPSGIYDYTTDCLTVTNNDNDPHIIAYKFEVTVPKKENIFLTDNGLKNETNSISFAIMIGEIKTYTKSDDYVIDMIFYPVYTTSSNSFYFQRNMVDFRDSVFTKQKYNNTQYRGTKELNFSCKFYNQDLYPLIFYFDFEKPFFRLEPYDNAGYLIPISFLDCGSYNFTVVTRKYDIHPTHDLQIINPPQVNIENNKLDKEEYYKTIDNSMKLIYDIEFPSNVLYSFNYFFDDDQDSKITEYIYGTNYNEHIERTIDLPSSLTSSDHKLHYFFNATGLTTDTFENSFSLIYHKPIIHLLTENDENDPPIFIHYVNDSFSIEYDISDEDPEDTVTSVVSIEPSTIIKNTSNIAPYHVEVNPNFGDTLNEGGKRIIISAIDKYNCISSKQTYFYFIYKFNRPEIEFQSENNISKIDNFVRIQCRVRDYRGNGLLTIEANLTADNLYNCTKKKEREIEDDSFKEVIIDIPINKYYQGNCTISLCVSNTHDEISSLITSIFALDEIPTFNVLDKFKKLIHPNKSLPFIFTLLSNK